MIRRNRSTDSQADAARRRLALLGVQLDEPGRPSVSYGAPGSAPADAEPPPGAPRSGRHSSGRSRSSHSILAGLHDRLPVMLHSRFGGAGLTTQHVVVVVLVLAGFVAIAAWWVLSSRPSDVSVAEPPSVAASAGEPGAAADGSSQSAGPADDDPDVSASAGADATVPPDAEGGSVVVDVTGKVRNPGIVTLPAGSRIVDAIESAGGAKPGASLTGVNLAQVLVDGEQIVVGMPSAPPAVPGDTGDVPGDSAAPTTLINLNTATMEELDTLPGVGPVTGQAILDWRTENGQFTTVEELLEVNGIGEITLDELRDLVTVLA